MSSEIKRIEKSVNVVVGKPVTWGVYGLLVAGRYVFQGIVRCCKWVRSRFSPSVENA